MRLAAYPAAALCVARRDDEVSQSKKNTPADDCPTPTRETARLFASAASTFRRLSAVPRWVYLQSHGVGSACRPGQCQPTGRSCPIPRSIKRPSECGRVVFLPEAPVGGKQLVAGNPGDALFSSATPSSGVRNVCTARQESVAAAAGASSRGDPFRATKAHRSVKAC